MPTTLDFPSQKQTSVGTTLRFQLLPLGSRIPTSYTITADADQTAVTDIVTAADINIGDTAVTLATAVTLPDKAKITFANGVSVRLDGAVAASTALTIKPAKGAVTGCADQATTLAVPTGTAGVYNHGTLAAGSEYVSVVTLPEALFPGEELIFDAAGTPKTVTVASYVPKGSVVLETLPIAAALTAAETAETLATVAIAGATDASPSSQPKIVDGTNFSSGAGYEGVTTGTNRTLNFSFQNILGDPGSDILKSILYDDEFYNREIYAILRRDPGDRDQAETYEGACIATQGDQASPVQDLITITANLQFQGASFKYTPTTDSYDICNPDAYCPPGLSV